MLDRGASLQCCLSPHAALRLLLSPSFQGMHTPTLASAGEEAAKKWVWLPQATLNTQPAFLGLSCGCEQSTCMQVRGGGLSKKDFEAATPQLGRP